MNYITRRHFLQFSALSSGGLLIAACQPILRHEKTGQQTSRPLTSRRVAVFSQEAKKVMEEHKIPGLSVGIIQDHELIYADGFGVRNLKTGESMTTKSVMSMASISKAFTATAIMQLVEAGEVNIDDPYVKYVPYFEMEDTRYKDITIRHLIAHNSGMPELTQDLFFKEWDDPSYDDGAAERYVRSFKKGIMLNQEPGGDKFIYSDFGYDILADLIHNASGELFEDYIKHHIFKPRRVSETVSQVRETLRYMQLNG